MKCEWIQVMEYAFIVMMVLEVVDRVDVFHCLLSCRLQMKWSKICNCQMRRDTIGSANYITFAFVSETVQPIGSANRLYFTCSLFFCTEFINVIVHCLSVVLTNLFYLCLWIFDSVIVFILVIVWLRNGVNRFIITPAVVNIFPLQKHVSQTVVQSG